MARVRKAHALRLRWGVGVALAVVGCSLSPLPDLPAHDDGDGLFPGAGGGSSAGTGGRGPAGGAGGMPSSGGAASGGDAAGGAASGGDAAGGAASGGDAAGGAAGAWGGDSNLPDGASEASGGVH